MGASWLKSSRVFFDQVRQEAKRIVWPTQRDVFFTSVIVFAIAAMFAVFLFFVDQVVIAGLQVIL
jgi:preprotein translocase subunit SecE